MGKYNSSTYRITPLIEYIKDDLDKINMLLSCFGVSVKRVPFDYFYGENEKLIKPSKQHLINIVDYLYKSNDLILPTMTKDRTALLSGDPVTREQKRSEAIRLINEKYNKLTDGSRYWYIFEGFTHPDLFIEGEDYILIGEGKWTEDSITTHTDNLPQRNQMVRHIQAALNYSEKRIYAFYLVDANCGYLNDLTKEALAKQIDDETIAISSTDKEMILKSFVGFITWQGIQKMFPNILFLTKEEINSQK